MPKEWTEFVGLKVIRVHRLISWELKTTKNLKLKTAIYNNITV